MTKKAMKAVGTARTVRRIVKRPGWKFPKSEAKTSDIDNLAFLACI